MRSDATIKTGIVTTKGDILSHSTTPDRLAVGTTGYVLVANSSTSTGLEWQSLATKIETDYGLNAKGEILGHDGTDPVAISAGSYPQILVADDAPSAGASFLYPWQGMDVTTTLTDAASTDLLYTDVTDQRTFWMRLRFNIVAYNGTATNIQGRTGILNIRGHRVGGGAPTINAGDPLESEVYSFASSGTLTVTWGTATTAGGRVALNCTADSSFTTPTISITFQLEQVDANAVSVLSFTP
jgi:hypothetical protein